MTTTLHTKYRPVNFDGVLDQDALTASLKDVLDKGGCRAFILTGPSGCGKTTLGRIIAGYTKCSKHNLTEIDAATHTGVDGMREIIESLQLSPLGDSKTRVTIVDEAHMLSKAAWNALLKSVEEPPPDYYWVFCTTEASKIPETIRTRCTSYEVKPVKPDLLFEYLQIIRDDEKFTASDDVLYLIARSCEGSTRRALTFLSQCSDIKDKTKAVELIKTAEENEDGAVGELLRALATGLTWTKVQEILLKLVDIEPESIRRTVLAYMTKVALSAKGAGQVLQALAVLEAFGEPYPSPSGSQAPLVVSLGKLCFEDAEGDKK